MADGPLNQVIEHIRTLVGSRSLNELTDAELLERFATQRDEAAFTLLVERHGRMVWGVCRRVLAHGQDAEDAYQAAFLVLARKAAARGWRDSVGGWLCAVAYRVARKAKATADRRRGREKEMVDVPHDEAASAVGWQDLRAVLDEELQRLPAKCRAPLVLCYLEGKTNEQAAHELRCPVGTVWYQLSRGAELLRARLSRRGLALSAGALAALIGQNAGTAAEPAGLAAPTIRAALLFAASSAGAGGVSVQVLTLVEGVLKAMWLTRLTIVVLVLATVAALGAGAGMLWQRPAADGDKGQPAAEASTGGPTGKSAEDPRLQQLRRKLATPVAGDLSIDGNTPLKDALALLANRYGVKFVFDRKAFQTVGVADPGELPVRLAQMPPSKLSSVLRLLLPRVADNRYAVRYRLRPDAIEITPALGQALERGTLGPLTELRVGESLEERAVRKKATTPIDRSVRFDQNTPLREGLGFLADLLEVNILIDDMGFRTIHPAMDISVAPIQLAEVNKTSLATIMQLLARQVPHAGFVLRDNWLEMRPVDQARPGRSAFSPDGTLLATVGHGEGALDTLRLWRVDTGKEVRRLTLPGQRLGAFGFSADGKVLTAVYPADPSDVGNILCRWEVATGKKLRQEQGASESHFALAPDGKLVAGVRARALCFWDAATGGEVRRCPGAPDASTALAFSADGRLLVAVGGEPTAPPAAALWEVATGKRLLQVPLVPAGISGNVPVRSAVLSPDGRLLAVVDVLGRAGLWELISGQRVASCRVPGSAGPAAFSPDGRWLALAVEADEPQVCLCATATGQAVSAHRVEGVPITALVFSADGQRLAAGTEDATAIVCSVPAPPRAPATRLTPRQLESLWGDLASADAAKARRAIHSLAAAPGEAVALLRWRLRPVSAEETQRVRALIAELDSNRFEVREKAMEALLAVPGGLVEPALQQVLASKPSAEVRRRVQHILDRLKGPITVPEQLRGLRAIEVLEQVATTEARQALTTLAGGAADTWLTREAKAALQRLGKGKPAP